MKWFTIPNGWAQTSSEGPRFNAPTRPTGFEVQRHALGPQFLVASGMFGRSEDSLHGGKLVAQFLARGSIDWCRGIENPKAPFKLENASGDGGSLMCIERYAMTVATGVEHP